MMWSRISSQVRDTVQFSAIGEIDDYASWSLRSRAQDELTRNQYMDSIQFEIEMQLLSNFVVDT